MTQIQPLNTVAVDLPDEVRENGADDAHADHEVSEFRSELRSHVEHGFTEMRGKLDGAAAGQQHIVELIQGITKPSE